MPHARRPLAQLSLAATLLSTSLALGAAGCSRSAGPLPLMVVVIPPPLPETGATKVEADAEARADRDRMSSSDTLVGRWREEFTGRSGCSDEAVLSRSSSGLTVKMEDCNSKRPYTTRSVTYEGGTFELELLAPESSYPLRYSMKRTQKGVLEGEVLVGEGDEPSRYKVKWIKER